MTAKIHDAELKAIVEKHAKWLRGEYGGEYANLCGANLCDPDLCNADLRYANLSDTNLYRADLSYADLRYANLRYANLRDADLRYADLRNADLSHADLHYANLSDADLRYAKNIDKIKWNMSTAFYPLQCPETGSFIGYKSAQDKIIMLEICADAKRSSATSRKCRCSKAKVSSITNMDGSESESVEVASDYDKDFIYRVGETVEVPDFDENRWNECAAGIHFFITRDEAVMYQS